MRHRIFSEANKIWQEFTKNATDKNYKIPFQIDKKLLNLFHIGECYYYVFDVKNSAFEFVSPEIFTLLGYVPEVVDVPFLLSLIHPEDQPFFLNFENKVTEFFNLLQTSQVMNYKVSYDYRLLKKDGSYVRILQQVFTIQMDGRNVIKTFGIHTNINHLKPTGVPVLSFIGLNGEPCYFNVNVRNVFSTSSISLTRRERDILALLVKGKTSEDISETLFISKFTVDTHRKNLLRKTDCANTASLISVVLQNGWM